ncbi:aldehyde dehydrogenase family protein [Sphingomonas sp. CGMCC 1.13654]|uniref:Aldehyde dehydrogenase family protein n=1 Tax=Sphingomonas chungangi TaxID=2683589 RepID=A0A838L747_9SPHN|nr:aldehyde dehydrogenase family protein [Sphingomonas chungangi]MBA2933966.1 aldehyde dehydrogenase family protein [Sphingomonas chungangi]MVW57091.1 aldehyde dehydrogenase family protein [Sphingomonas chungangi]
MSGGKSFVLDPGVQAFLARDHGAFVEGKTASQGGAGIAVHDPSTGGAISRVAAATAQDVDQAVTSARRAFEDARWRGLTPAAREHILLRFADLIDSHADALAQLETLEQGKSIIIARHLEVAGAVQWTRYAAGLATKITGMTLDVSGAPPGSRAFAYTQRAPVGVVAGIVPWNFPLAIAIWKIAPALAAGCSIVLKPSEFTPLTALRLAELAIEAGVPPGVFNVITGDGATAGNALVGSPSIAKISFTGSTAVGKTIGRRAADTMTHVTLELGGKNPAIVLADADVDTTVAGLSTGAFANQGQVCAAASRIYIEASIFDQIAAGLEQTVRGMVVGPGLDPAAQINPLVSAVHRDKVMRFLSEARDDRLELIQGQGGPNPSGFYVPPTLVISPSPDSRLAREEVFGPVLALTPVADVKEALRLANGSELGLAASLWTRDLNAAFALIPRIEAGTVWVNSHLPIDPNVPFGGFKQSGIGQDFGPRWLDGYTHEKSVWIVHGA